MTATRSTHGLHMLARAGLDDLLATAPARAGTPLGEPGTRQLPSQTHQRILESFARGTLDVSAALGDVKGDSPVNTAGRPAGVKGTSE